MKSGSGILQSSDPSNADSRLRLRLYVTGATGRSLRAIVNIRAICREYLQGTHTDLKIIDLYRNPSFARNKQIFAAPTLVKENPIPVIRIIGDLSEKEKVLRALGLKPDTPLPVHG